jgi:putative flippase GtrA
MIDKLKIKYLLAGGVNTIFGYFISLSIYQLLKNDSHIIIIGIISNIVAITFTFLIYKLFVFCSKGNWLKEYFKSYLVYGGGAIIGTLAIWVLVDKFSIPFAISQGIITIAMVCYSFFMNKNFTFRKT